MCRRPTKGAAILLPPKNDGEVSSPGNPGQLPPPSLALRCCHCRYIHWIPIRFSLLIFRFLADRFIGRKWIEVKRWKRSELSMEEHFDVKFSVILEQ